MERWRQVWRVGIVPELSTAQLTALQAGLLRDDPHLLQGATTCPPPLHCVLDWPVEGACAIGYATWQAGDVSNVGEVEEFFANVCFKADQRLGEPAAVRYFLTWMDDAPRDEMRAKLIDEVNRELANRTNCPADECDADKPAMVAVA